MIQNQLRLIPLDDITINRDKRQRKVLDPTHILSLCQTISANGLLQNIGVSFETLDLKWGECRYTAFTWLRAAFESKPIAELTKEQNKTLQTCAAKTQYENWTKIPARLIKNLSPLSEYALEFIENVNRSDLSWQDKSVAAYELHARAVAMAKDIDSSWSDTNSAALLGIGKAYFSELVTPLRELNSASPKLKPKLQAAIKDSASARSATSAARTIKERHGESNPGSLSDKLFSGRKITSEGKVEKKETAPPPKLESPIICADFTEWAKTYEGPRFNFIHCDFPYGIEFNKSGGQNTSAASKAAGDYDDSAETYWHLVRNLLLHRKRLVADSAHIMFWYSQNLDDETRDEILNAWPDAVISKFRLIWHCSDNSGLMPAPTYEGRRTYETAFQITIGARKLAKPAAMSFSSPRNTDKIHRSQKHIPVLSHFFRQYVDSSTLMLDPTCGSGTSLTVAKQLNAKHIVGLEIDPEMVELATKQFRSL